MGLLYCQASLERKKEYQVITKIVQGSDNKKLVIKRAVYPEGMKHIQQTFENEQVMKSSHPGHTPGSVIGADKMEITTPYIEGKTIGELLRDALINKKLSKADKIIKKWKDIIIGKAGTCPFYITEQFIKVFDYLEFPNNTPAIKVSNFDAIGENLIVQNDGSVICIDLEWVFSFPVPVDFIFFRVLYNFYLENPNICRPEELYELAAIDAESIETYKKGIDSFEKYVFWDKERNIKYNEFGKLFKQPQINQNNRIRNQDYIFPICIEKQYKKIAVYGAGKVGQSYAAYINNSNAMELTGWVDKKADLYRKREMDIYMPSELPALDFDVLLVAVAKESLADEIKKELVVIGIDEEKMYWTKPIRT